jgi:hypothetical protein
MNVLTVLITLNFYFRGIFLLLFFVYIKHISTSLVVWWSELLNTNHEVPGSIPGSTMGIFL